MTDKPYMTIFIDSQVQNEDSNALLESIRGYMEIHAPKQRQFVDQWIMFVAIMKDIGTIAGGAAAVVKLANEIISWRNRVRNSGHSEKVRLQRPDKLELDLERAEDQEVIDWLSGTPQ